MLSWSANYCQPMDFLGSSGSGVINVCLHAVPAHLCIVVGLCGSCMIVIARVVSARKQNLGNVIGPCHEIDAAHRRT
jgi:hypothetical protein